jgi:long-chain fatty acid transport protein
MSIPIKYLFAYLFNLCIVLFFSSPVMAGGPAHGGKAAGMGTAFAAVADDPSTIAHNPGGIGFLEGTRLYLGAMAVAPNTRYKSDDGPSEETETQIFVVPHAYLTSDLEWNGVTVGLGFFSPFGIGGRKWPNDGALQYYSRESLVATFLANPVAAWRVLPTLSIAFGVDYLWTYNHAEQKVDQSMLQAADGTSEFTADGGGWGWNVGMLWQVHRQFNIGAAYRSGITADLSGDIKLKDIAPVLQPLFGGSKMNSHAHTSLDFPDIATLGVAWYPNSRWTVTVEGEWIGWSSFARQTITVDEPVVNGGFDNSKIDLQWKNSWIAKAGMEMKIDLHWAVRFGYAYLSSPVPASTLTPANPDASQQNYCFGLGYTLDKATFDLFYVFATYQDREVTNDILSGEFSNKSHSLGFSVGWQF